MKKIYLPLLTTTLLANSVFAASLAETTTLVRSGSGTPTNAWDISVFDGSAAFAYDDGLGTTFATTTIGDGTVEDYAFYNSSGSFSAYAEGAANLIGTATVDESLDATGDARASSLSDVELFTTSAIGGTATFTSATSSRVGNATATIDLTGYSSGTLYVFFGTFSNAATVTSTLSGVGQVDIVADTGGLTEGSSNAFYVTEFAFETDGVYDSLTFTYNNTDADGSRARFAGVALDAVVAVPEPSSFALIAGFICIALKGIQRRR